MSDELEKRAGYTKWLADFARAEVQRDAIAAKLATAVELLQTVKRGAWSTFDISIFLDTLETK